MSGCSVAVIELAASRANGTEQFRGTEVVPPGGLDRYVYGKIRDMHGWTLTTDAAYADIKIELDRNGDYVVLAPSATALIFRCAGWVDRVVVVEGSDVSRVARLIGDDDTGPATTASNRPAPFGFTVMSMDRSLTYTQKP